MRVAPKGGTGPVAKSMGMMRGHGTLEMAVGTNTTRSVALISPSVLCELFKFWKSQEKSGILKIPVNCSCRSIDTHKTEDLTLDGLTINTRMEMSLLKSLILNDYDHRK